MEKFFLLILLLVNYHLYSDGGIMVSMVAFQAVDPGSIPGHRIFLTFVT